MASFSSGEEKLDKPKSGLTENQKAIVEKARLYLASVSVNDGAPDYNWFGCENDEELFQEILNTEGGGGFKCDEQDLMIEENLHYVLDVMYCG